MYVYVYVCVYVYVYVYVCVYIQACSQTFTLLVIVLSRHGTTPQQFPRAPPRRVST